MGQRPESNCPVRKQLQLILKSGVYWWEKQNSQREITMIFLAGNTMQSERLDDDDTYMMTKQFS